MKRFTCLFLSVIILASAALTGCGAVGKTGGSEKTELPSYHEKGSLEASITPVLPSYYEGLKFSDYISLGQYKGLFYEEYTDPGRDEAKYGDGITAEYAFEVEGEDGVRMGAHTFVLGASGFPREFDDMLAGAKIGEKVQSEFTFPEDIGKYGDLSGKKVKAAALVKVLDLSRYKELSEDDLWEDVVDESKILKWPKEAVEVYKADFRENFEAFAKQYGMSVDDYCKSFFKFSEEDLEEECLERAEDAVKGDLVMYLLWEKEGLSLTKEELENCKVLWLETYGYISEDDMPASWDDADVRRSLISMAQLRKVKDFIFENAKPER